MLTFYYYSIDSPTIRAHAPTSIFLGNQDNRYHTRTQAFSCPSFNLSLQFLGLFQSHSICQSIFGSVVLGIRSIRCSILLISGSPLGIFSGKISLNSYKREATLEDTVSVSLLVINITSLHKTTNKGVLSPKALLTSLVLTIMVCFLYCFSFLADLSTIFFLLFCSAFSVTAPPHPRAYQRVRRVACPTLARTHSLVSCIYIHRQQMLK